MQKCDSHIKVQHMVFLKMADGYFPAFLNIFSINLRYKNCFSFNIQILVFNHYLPYLLTFIWTVKTFVSCSLYCNLKNALYYTNRKHIQTSF